MRFLKDSFLVNFKLLKKVIIIFFVGLAFRFFINYIYDINVFKDYTSVISLLYYGFMSSFAVFINEFPKIGFNFFNFKLIKSAIKEYFDKLFLAMNSEPIKSESGSPVRIKSEPQSPTLPTATQPQALQPQTAQQAPALPQAPVAFNVVPPVQDPGGIRGSFLDPATQQWRPTYQPYARDLARHLDSIRNLPGGHKAVCLNDQLVNSADRLWLQEYFQAKQKVWNWQGNGKKLSKELRNLP